MLCPACDVILYERVALNKFFIGASSFSPSSVSMQSDTATRRKCNSFKDTHRQSALTDTHERRPQPSRKGKKILCIFSLAKSLESVYNKNE